jgi:hypothetical protein
LAEVFRVLSDGAREVARSNLGLAWAEIAVLDCVSRRDWLSASELLGMLKQGATFTTASPQFAPLPTPAPKEPPVPAPNLPSPQIQEHTPTPVPVITALTPPTSAGTPHESFQLIIEELVRQGVSGNAVAARLGSKLRQLGVERCDAKMIQIVAGSATFQTLNQFESKTLREVLSHCGFGSAEIRGIQLTKEAATPAAAPTDNQPNAKPAPQPQIRSVADLEREKRQSEEIARQERILQSPQIKGLWPLGEEREILPLDENE